MEISPKMRDVPRGKVFCSQLGLRTHRQSVIEERAWKNPPKEGEYRYNKVLKLGCGGYSYWTDCGYEFDCRYEYPWECGQCPIVQEHEKGEYAGEVLAVEG